MAITKKQINLSVVFLENICSRNHINDKTLNEPVREKTNNLGSDQVRHKPACTVTEDGQRLEILDLESRGTIRVAKTKALISFAVTAKLICAFVFACSGSCSGSNNNW